MTARRWIAVGAASAALVAGAMLQSARTATEGGQPWNVVVIVSDDQGLDSLPSDPPVMPYLQSIASDPNDNWVEFKNYFANTPLCCPSRATMFSGRYAHETGVLRNDDGNQFDETSTLATWLQDGGYTTGLAGKYLNEYPFSLGPYVPPGWDRWWGTTGGDTEDLYFNYTLVEQGVFVDYGDAPKDYATDVLASKAVQFVREAPADQPFFLWYAPPAPHPPWVSAPRDAGRYADFPITPPPSVGERDVRDKPEWIRKLPRLGPEVRAGLLEAQRRSYETLLALDDAVRSLIGALKSSGALDNTVIFFVSDNGFSFGEHRWVKKTCPYEECTHVPLLVRYPTASHHVVKTIVSSIDLAPTIAELAGVEPASPVSGTSLVPLLTDGDARLRRPNEAFLEWAGDVRIPSWWELRTPSFAYIAYDTGERELYDLRNDPYELENVAEDPAYAATLLRLAPALQRFRGS